MKLYHGTSERHLARIKRAGLKPRGHKKSNWKAHPSHPDAIYLTNSYAVFYANACARGKERLVVLEIDTDRLHPFMFRPDEDFLEQAGRGQDGVPGDMKLRSQWYRDNLHHYKGYLTDGIAAGTVVEHSPAALSLKHLGNCTYFSSIPPTAITKVAVINMDPVPQFVLDCFDPSIVLMNYKICGPKYRNSLKWLFGYELEYDPLEAMRQHPDCIPRPVLTRDGITIEEWS